MSFASPDSDPSPVIRRRRGREQKKCHICAQVFYKAEHLARHVRSHTKEKPFGCEFCKKLYCRQDVLLRHIRSHHNEALSEPNIIKQRTQARGIGSGVEDMTPSMSDSHESETMTDSGDENALNSLNPSYQCVHALSNQDSGETQTPSVVFPMQEGTMSLRPESEFLQANNKLGPLAAPQEGDSYVGLEPMQDFLDVWGTDLSLQQMPWLAGDDFDINALNLALSRSINSYSTMNILEQPSADANSFQFTPNDRPVTSNAIANTKDRWFTNIERVDGYSTGTNTPRDRHDPNQVDEVYRASLRAKLRQRLYDDSLPSTSYLNFCIRLYFTRFSALFPIVHPATFRPTARNSLLLLSMCSIGSLFIGSADAVAQGVKIFEVLNKSILASLERHLSKSRAEALSVIQACLIGQTFGMLSAQPSHIITVELFHGSIIAWARHNRAVKPAYAPTLQELLVKHDRNLDMAWRDWAECEARTRVALALYLHDAELASAFHHEPLLRHGVDKLPVPSPDSCWNASTAVQWEAAMRRLDEENISRQQGMENGNTVVHGLPVALSKMSRYYAYVSLDSISARVSESRAEGNMNDSAIARYIDDLIRWHKTYYRKEFDKHNDSFSCMMLWHYTFCRLYADFNLLERAVGRDGLEDSRLVRATVSEWVGSMAAKRCILHASLLQTQIETLLIGTEPAIHVPRILFHVALAWFCFINLRSSMENNHHYEAVAVINAPEFQHLKISASQVPFDVRDIGVGKSAMCDSSAVYILCDYLYRIGHWGISRKLASILAPLAYGGLDEEYWGPSSDP